MRKPELRRTVRIPPCSAEGRLRSKRGRSQGGGLPRRCACLGTVLEMPGAGTFCVRGSSARVAEDGGCVAPPCVAARGRGGRQQCSLVPEADALSRQGGGRAKGGLIPSHGAQAIDVVQQLRVLTDSKAGDIENQLHGSIFISDLKSPLPKSSSVIT